MVNESGLVQIRHGECARCLEAIITVASNYLDLYTGPGNDEYEALCVIRTLAQVAYADTVTENTKKGAKK